MTYQIQDNEDLSVVEMIAKRGLAALPQMKVESRLLQRAQSVRVPEVRARKVDDLLRACGGSRLYKNNPIERFFRDIYQSRGHIANNVDTYVCVRGTVMLGLPNADPFV